MRLFLPPLWGACSWPVQFLQSWGISLSYWVGQKLRLGFSIRCYGYFVDLLVSVFPFQNFLGGKSPGTIL